MNITYPASTTVPVILSGTTQLGTPGIPDLGGTVLEGEIRIFTAGKGSSIRGTLQDRVVQMNDTIGTLAFYSWIKEFNAPTGDAWYHGDVLRLVGVTSTANHH